MFGNLKLSKMKMLFIVAAVLLSSFLGYFLTAESLTGQRKVPEQQQQVREEPKSQKASPKQEVSPPSGTLITQNQPKPAKASTKEEKVQQSLAAMQQIIQGNWPGKDNPYKYIGETSHAKIYLDTNSIERSGEGVRAVSLLVLKNDSTYKAIVYEYLFPPDKTRALNGSRIFILNNGHMFDQTDNSWEQINPNTPLEATRKAAWDLALSQ